MSLEYGTYLDAAVQAVSEAAGEAQTAFGSTLPTTQKGFRGDIATDLDRRCDSLIVNRLRKEFPTHEVIAEESGLHEGAAGNPWRWLVDPLDGTNNFAIGLPIYGCSVTLCYEGEPVLVALSGSNSAGIAHAILDQGAWVDGKQALRDQARSIHGPATAVWIGYATRYDQTLRSLTNILNAVSRRVFSTWAPTVDSLSFLRGSLDAIVAYNCVGQELLGCLMLIREAGGVIVDARGIEVTRLRSAPPLIFAGQPRTVETLVSGMRSSEMGLS